eukprot:GHVQ01035316.1.p1 GENE.GHVQ01035316.1~~GHVQ01035316.1.p1  ORF type:complete len:219 (-),score=14.48 GHVQ01035316.1:2140-2796(-)
MSPLRVTKDVRMAPRRFSQIFDDVLSTEFQLFEAHPKNTLSVLLNFEDVPDLLCFVLLQPKLFPCVFSCMASAFLARGTATISGILDNICRIKPKLKLSSYSQETFKIGLCKVPPLDQAYSLLLLSNSCASQLLMTKVRNRFLKLYNRKAHLHHYRNLLRCDTEFEDALDGISSLIEDYSCVAGGQVPRHSCKLRNAQPQEIRLPDNHETTSLGVPFL